jgi:hypothetical protein
MCVGHGHWTFPLPCAAMPFLALLLMLLDKELKIVKFMTGRGLLLVSLSIERLCIVHVFDRYLK